MAETSTKPYLLRAIYEWCTDNGYTPYLAAMVDAKAVVPMQFVKNGEIVLNISFAATSNLKMENDSIHFSARFGGVARDIMVPVDNVIALYARENGQGMAFEVPSRFPARDEEPAGTVPVAAPADETAAPPSDTTPDEPPEPPKKGGRPTLTRIK